MGSKIESKFWIKNLDVVLRFTLDFELAVDFSSMVWFSVEGRSEKVIVLLSSFEAFVFFYFQASRASFAAFKNF